MPVNTFIVILGGCMRLKTSYVHGARRGKGVLEKMSVIVTKRLWVCTF